MTQEEKELLLKDLCGRLPYGVKGFNNAGQVIALNFKTQYRILDGISYAITKYEWKPYLFPMFSMTEEQRKEYNYITERWMYDSSYSISDSIDWLNKNHFDYRGLIEKGLALDATGLNIY